MVKEKTSVPPENSSVKTEEDNCILNTFRTVKVWSASVSVVRIDIRNVSMVTESLEIGIR